MPEQVQATRNEQNTEVAETAVVNEAGRAAIKGAQETTEKADDFLESLDELLGTDEEALEFVNSYRQKGGQ